MPRLALKALEAYGQLEPFLFIDGQHTSMLIRGGGLRGVPQGCALSVHFCNLAGWAWNVCMNRELPHVRTNAYLDDRLMSADSCDPLPRTLEITKQVDDFFGAVLNSKRGSPFVFPFLTLSIPKAGSPWNRARVQARTRFRRCLTASSPTSGHSLGRQNT